MIAEQIERRGAYNGDDSWMIQDMLVPLTHEEAVERAERFGIPSNQIAKKNNYTCRYWDEDTRLCTVHPNRPTLCRDYPYGKKCGHGCGWGEEETEKMTCNHNVTLGSE
jgi:Fe-S-cluster containining protein